jgi:hypothetical protein
MKQPAAALPRRDPLDGGAGRKRAQTQGADAFADDPPF